MSDYYSTSTMNSESLHSVYASAIRKFTHLSCTGSSKLGTSNPTKQIKRLTIAR